MMAHVEAVIAAAMARLARISENGMQELGLLHFLSIVGVMDKVATSISTQSCHVCFKH